MRSILARLELCSNGTISSYAPPSRGAYDGQEPRTGDDDPPHLTYARAYQRATTDAQHERVIKDAEAALKQLRYAPKPQRLETEAEENRRIIKEGLGYSADEVSFRFRCLKSRVWKVRELAGRDRETGKLPETPPEGAQERAERVRGLRREGYGSRNIAFLLGVPHTTVIDDLRRAA